MLAVTIKLWVLLNIVIKLWHALDSAESQTIIVPIYYDGEFYTKDSAVMHVITAIVLLDLVQLPLHEKKVIRLSQL